MASKRKAAAVRSPGIGPFTSIARVVQHTARPVCLYVLPSLALVAICVLGLRWANAHVSQAPRFRARALRPPIGHSRPAWWQPSFEKQIVESVAFAEGRSLLDPTLAVQVAAGYARCPWVQSVRRVEKAYPDRIEASLVWRRPGSVVEVVRGRRRRYLLVGEDGVRLPAVFASWPVPELAVPFIRGVPSRKLPLPGEPWAERSVVAAMQITSHLAASDVISQAIRVTGVDVSNYRGRVDPRESEFLVLAEHNCVIEWGREPNTDRPGELPVLRKIRWLERYIQQGGPVRNHRLRVRFADYDPAPRTRVRGR
jgi:hypothetical protein